LETARSRIGRPFLLAQYFNAARSCPAIAALTRDALLVEAAGRYLRVRPRLVGVNLWWSYPAQASHAERDVAAQLFHDDLDDFRFIKFFFYLTDVDELAGPHIAVRGSHTSKRPESWLEILRIRRYTDDEITRRYGDANIVTITGVAGTGFAEDTSCIHKGLPPVRSARLLLQIQFALNDFGNQNDIVDERELRLVV
jgi:hypothetical protein